MQVLILTIMSVFAAKFFISSPSHSERITLTHELPRWRFLCLVYWLPDCRNHNFLLCTSVYISPMQFFLPSSLPLPLTLCCVEGGETFFMNFACSPHLLFLHLWSLLLLVHCLCVPFFCSLLQQWHACHLIAAHSYFSFPLIPCQYFLLSFTFPPFTHPPSPEIQFMIFTRSFQSSIKWMRVWGARERRE